MSWGVWRLLSLWGRGEWKQQWENRLEEIFASSALITPWHYLGAMVACSFTDKTVTKTLLG